MSDDIDFKSLEEGWFLRNWRPAMAWQYFIVCLYDFIGGPITQTVLQGYYHQPITQWAPLTLQGGGLYHLAMAAIVGVYTYARSLEKITLAGKGIISGNLGDSGISMPVMAPIQMTTTTVSQPVSPAKT